MITLNDILIGVEHSIVQGNVDQVVKHITFDSRDVVKNSVFVAIKGTQTDGHLYISKALENGASCIIAEDIPSEIKKNKTYIKTKDSSEALGIIASNFYAQPSHSLHLIGVTGTNGKTTTVNLLRQIFNSMGYKTGILATTGIIINEQVFEATHTTPDPLRINMCLKKMVDEHVTHAFMEVSSHALAQQRVSGLKFSGGIFTNITHDHLDYHKSFDNYIAAKKKLFDMLDAEAFALSNIDDKRGMVMLQNTKAKKVTYSLKKLADYKAKVLSYDFEMMELLLDGKEVHTQLTGIFNAYNLLAAYAATRESGISKQDALRAVSNVKPAEGRFDLLKDPNNEITGIIDYAHTPDALENVLKNIREINQYNGRVITLIGCGGNRDKTKRPEMAQIAAKYSDQAILTNDNPRYEEPADILREMENGLSAEQKHKVLKIEDRKEAIRTACKLAGKNDIILVAGKGHEKYQEINGKKYPFDDKAILKACFDESLKIEN